MLSFTFIVANSQFYFCQGRGGEKQNKTYRTLQIVHSIENASQHLNGDRYIEMFLSHVSFIVLKAQGKKAHP